MGMRMKSKEKTLVFIGIILILAITVYFVSKEIRIKDTGKECNITCIKQQTTCCSCSMGGKEECMTEQEAAETQARLESECRKDIVCVAMYACEDFECKCKDSECIKEYLKT